MKTAQTPRVDAIRRKHWVGRPPAGSTKVERLTREGKWVPDDGKNGLAFSGLGGEGAHPFTPFAWGPGCDCGFDDKCPFRQAMTRTCARFSCANGRDMRRKR